MLDKDVEMDIDLVEQPIGQQVYLVKVMKNLKLYTVCLPYTTMNCTNLTGQNEKDYYYRD